VPQRTVKPERPPDEKGLRMNDAAVVAALLRRDLRFFVWNS
jgi:hypothetical protein